VVTWGRLQAPCQARAPFPAIAGCRAPRSRGGLASLADHPPQSPNDISGSQYLPMCAHTILAWGTAALVENLLDHISNTRLSAERGQTGKGRA
jgi:hypothetical protein